MAPDDAARLERVAVARAPYGARHTWCGPGRCHSCCAERARGTGDQSRPATCLRPRAHARKDERSGRYARARVAPSASPGAQRVLGAAWRACRVSTIRRDRQARRAHGARDRQASAGVGDAPGRRLEPRELACDPVARVLHELVNGALRSQAAGDEPAPGARAHTETCRTSTTRRGSRSRSASVAQAP